MARKPRLEFPDAIYRVISCGNQGSIEGPCLCRSPKTFLFEVTFVIGSLNTGRLILRSNDIRLAIFPPLSGSTHLGVPLVMGSQPEHGCLKCFRVVFFWQRSLIGKSKHTLYFLGSGPRESARAWEPFKLTSHRSDLTVVLTECDGDRFHNVKTRSTSLRVRLKVGEIICESSWGIASIMRHWLLPRRGFPIQSRVAHHARYPGNLHPPQSPTLNGLSQNHLCTSAPQDRDNPFRVGPSDGANTQGSSATLGYRKHPRWGYVACRIGVLEESPASGCKPLQPHSLLITPIQSPARHTASRHRHPTIYPSGPRHCRAQTELPTLPWCVIESGG